MVACVSCGTPTESIGFEIRVVNADVAPAGAALIVEAGKVAPATLAEVRGPAIVVPCGASMTLTLTAAPSKDAAFDMYVVPPGRLAGGGRLGDMTSGHITLYLTTAGAFASPEPAAAPPPFKCPTSR